MLRMTRHHAAVVLLLGLSSIATVGAQRGAPKATLEVDLVVAVSGDERLHPWAMDRPGASFESATEVKAGQPAVAQARVRGCTPGASSGLCDVVVQYTVTGPDGSTFRQEPAKPIEAGKPAPALLLTLSKDDRPGLYTVATLVRDSNARRLVRAERIFGLRIE